MMVPAQHVPGNLRRAPFPHSVKEPPCFGRKGLDVLHFHPSSVRRERVKVESCLLRSPADRQRVALSCAPSTPSYLPRKCQCGLPLSNWAQSGAGSWLIPRFLDKAADDSAPAPVWGHG